MEESGMRRTQRASEAGITAAFYCVYCFGAGTVWKQTVPFLFHFRKKERITIMLYQICNGAVRFAAETVLEHINFEIRNKEKIAVVGRNGCGKTTLLKLIAGEVELSKRDSDEDIYIARAGKPVIGYLKQNAFEDDSLTMEQEVRKAFSELLAMKAEMERLVVLMEKENEEAAVSRYVRLEERFAYLGGYSFEKEYEIVIKKLGFSPEDKQQKDYELQQKEIERLQTLVERFKNKPTKVAMTRSKLKQIEHMVKIDAPARYDLKSFHADFQPARESVTVVLRAAQLRIGYDRPLAEVIFEQKKGQKIGIIGDNGSGKSTLLRTLTGQLEPLGGSFAFGDRVDIGYFEQQMAQYTSDKTVLEDFWEEFPDLKRLEVRSWLGAFLFGQEEVFKKIDMLSGGEKVRLALAKIFRRLPNYLILDEPTNHMDIVGKESLEAMLKAYPGSVLFVSHDRYFVKEIADSLLVFENGTVNFYPYGYEQYWEKMQADEKERQDQQADGKPGKLQPVGKNIGVSAKNSSPEKAGAPRQQLPRSRLKTPPTGRGIIREKKKRRENVAWSVWKCSLRRRKRNLRHTRRS